MEAIEKKLMNSSQSLLEKSRFHVESEMPKPVGPSKKRKLSPTQHELNDPPIKRKMNDEEKHKVGRELEDMLGDLPDNVIEFLRAHSSNGGDEEDEIEIDIDVLSNETLFTLQELLNYHWQEKQASQAKSESCEMELPNEPDLSNSSLQVEKEYNEDLDIGGNEAPVTSYPPVRIGEVAAGGAYRCSDAGPESWTTSDEGSEFSKDSSCLKQRQDDVAVTVDSKKRSGVNKPVDGLCVTAQAKRQLTPDKQYRAALLKNRFADTILKAQEKPLVRMIRGILRNFDAEEKCLRCTRKKRRLGCEQKPRLWKMLEGEQKQKQKLQLN